LGGLVYTGLTWAWGIYRECKSCHPERSEGSVIDHANSKIDASLRSAWQKIWGRERKQKCHLERGTRRDLLRLDLSCV